VTEAGYRPHDVAWTEAKIAQFWDDYGSDEAHGSAYFSSYAGSAIVERVERIVPLRDRRVLDFGSGRGDLLGHLFGRGIAAEGLEFSEESAEITRRRFAGQPLFGDVEVAARLPSGLRERSFDVVFLVEVLEHLLDDQIGPVLDEARRVLVPGGHVVATTPNDEELAGEAVRCPDCGARFHRWQHLRSFSAASMAALFAGHGFEAHTAEGTNWTPPRLRRVRALLGRPQPRPHLLYVGVSRDGAR
jgi:SAM-dependent methyltransferase